ncbi:MAG: DNA sulfur modification protein DndE [Phycisphaerae bacterium]|nr:DNA sulfur modification protein DndE [Phycisphaerae bacterium]
MRELALRKIPFTAESDNRLRTLKARTGLDRNYICRMGFCLSLEEPGVPTASTEKAVGAREIDRYTLLGQHARAYEALMLAWMNENKVKPSSAGGIDGMFVAHMNRGVEIMVARVRSLADLAGLLPKQRNRRSGLRRRK